MINLKKELDDLEKKGLYRRMPLLETGQAVRVKIDGREIINFCSNDYLGLASDRRLKEAAKQAIDKYGVGAGASRLVCGNTYLQQELEEKLAEFKRVESCLVFSCGYMANLGIISTLSSRDSVILSDRLNHASIMEGIILSRAEFKRYPHCDMSALENLLKELEDHRHKLIITDSVFSMDGDIAPLKEIVHLADKYAADVMIDEAHATGVLGECGRGALEHLGIEDRIGIQMGTLSKAFGSYGAYVCGVKELKKFFINKARPFIYTTALPPVVAAASIKGLEIIQCEPERRRRLWENTEYLRHNLISLGFDTMHSQTPIIPILIGDSALTMEFSRRLFDNGIYVQGIRPPTVPTGKARLRLTVSANHIREDIDKALEYIGKVGKELGVTLP